MIITVKSVSEELKEDNKPKHIEWEAISANGQETKVKLYPFIKLGDEWLHFEDRWNEFRNAQNKSYDIERANIKTGKGYWKPVIKATEIKNIFVKQAPKQVENTRELSIEQQVSYKGAVELLSTKVIELNHPLAKKAIAWAMNKLEVLIEETELIEKSVAEEESAQIITWQLIQPNLSKLYTEKKPGWASTSSILTTLRDLGATDKPTIQDTFETLNNEGKQKFAELIDKALLPDAKIE